MKEFLKTFFNICQKSPSISLGNVIDFLDILQKLNDSILDNIINISKEVFKFGNYEEHKNLAFILHQLYQKNYITKEDLSIIFNSKYPFIFIDIHFQKKKKYFLKKETLKFTKKVFHPIIVKIHYCVQSVKIILIYFKISLYKKKILISKNKSYKVNMKILIFSNIINVA